MILIIGGIISVIKNGVKTEQREEFDLHTGALLGRAVNGQQMALK